jgi:hypothetical protein
LEFLAGFVGWVPAGHWMLRWQNQPKISPAAGQVKEVSENLVESRPTLKEQKE